MSDANSATPEQAATTEPRSVRMAMHFVVAVQVMAAIYELTRGTAFTLAVGIVFLAGAIGVHRRLLWGRALALLTMWGLLLFAIASIFPERGEADKALGVASPAVETLVVQLVVLCGLGLASLHLLGKHKARFRSGWI